MVTKTINQLHFEDLDPIRFEELILSIVYRMKKWYKLDHFGKKGSDDGIDIRAVDLLENGVKSIYYFQCKRYLKITNAILKKIVDDYIRKNSYIPQFYVLVVSCALTKKQIEYFESYCSQHEFNNVIVWTSSIIEAKLYSEYHDLLYTYFNVKAKENTQIESIVYDDYEEYIENYQKKMFWGRSIKTSLENLYVWNSYYIGSSVKYNDLEKLVNAFLNNGIDEFLDKKNIYQYDSINAIFIKGYPGCGKTSLITKLASLYGKEYATKCKIYFINMARFYYEHISVENIIDKLNITKLQLKGCCLIIDSLDEALKNVKNIQESVENLLDELDYLGCKIIITCRSNLIEESVLRNCLCIAISAFDKIEVKKWLDNFYAVNSDFKINEWKARIDKIDDKISKIIFMPLIIYICVVQNIEIDNLKSIGELYDILFDISRGQVATTNYRKKANLSNNEWLELRNFVVKISIKMYQNGILTQDDIKNNDFKTQQLENYFGLDFYVEQEIYEIKFVHSSIWQYFVAERLYFIIKSFEKHKCCDKIMRELSDIFVLNKKLDNMILMFLNYFINRDLWNTSKVEDYIGLLIHISDFSFEQPGDKFEWIALFFGELFKIITLVVANSSKNMLEKFFPLISSGKYHTRLLKYTNSSVISPIESLKSYKLINCNLNGINLNFTDLSGCVIRASSFRDAWFNNTLLIGTYADRCDFCGSNFQKADLKNADLSYSNLCGCDFRNSRLNGANFSDVILNSADLRGAKIEKINLNNAKMYNCIIDVSQMRGFGMEKIMKYDIEVYENDKKLAKNEIEIKYKELNPVSYVFWKREPL